MSITPERFSQGLSYSDFKAQMTRNRDRLEQNEQTVELSNDDIAFFAQLPAPIHTLVIAEDWCGDVIANLPVLARLAEQSGTLDVRIFLRDQNLDLIDQYLKNGQFRAIPVFVFFDRNFRELGYWIERPAQVSQLQEQMIDQLYAGEPEFAGVPHDTAIGQLPEPARIRLMQALGSFREQNRVRFDHEVVRELRNILSQSISSAPQAGAVAQPAAAQPAVKVSITYCASCGYEPQTLDLAAALMREFIYDLSAIELIPWQDGAFDVVVGGELIHSMYRDGGFPEHATIISAVREQLGKK